jgi:DNA (cytosine-5)-methyltransferase 1
MTAFLDLFSGIGGFALGAYWAGLRFDKHYFSEVDGYAVKLYQKRFPNSEPLGDIRNVDYSKLHEGEYLVTGGFPCQPHSVAGKKKGAGDERDFWPECRRMLCELRPSIALFENVTGLFTTGNGEFFNGILSDISESGYDAEWQVISARSIGAPHKRERIWITAYAKSGGLSTNKQRVQSIRKNCFQKPQEWKPLFSLSARDYTIQHWKDYEQILTGNYDGIPEELDAIKGAGNAVVPQCVEMIFNLPAFDRWRKI